MVTDSYSGTPAERWHLAGIDVPLGRITAAEVHELGKELVREMEEAVGAAHEETKFAESERRDAEADTDRLEGELRKAEAKIAKLEGAIDDLKRGNAE